VGVHYHEVANCEVADPVIAGLRWGGGGGAPGGKGGKPGDGGKSGQPGDGGKGGKPVDAGCWPYGACGFSGGTVVTAGGAGELPCGDVQEE